jgi:hypothetical protein
MEQAGDIIRLVCGALHVSQDFRGKNGHADTVLPECMSGELRATAHFLQILNYGSDHGKLADLPDP